MMLKQLRSREAGILTKTPHIFESIETDRRTTCLDLSKYKDFERAHTTPVVCGTVDPTECRYLISGSVDGTVAIHDLEEPVKEKGDIVSTYNAVAVVNKRSKPNFAHKHSVETATWYPFDTGMCLTSGGDRILKIWDTNSMTPVDDFEFSQIVNDHHMSSVARAHSLVAVATESTRIKLVDLKTGSASHILKGHEGAVLTVNWSTQDEFHLVSGARDGRALVWDIRRVKSVLFALDSENEGEPTRFKKYVLDAESHKSKAHSGSVLCVQFTPDGHHLLTTGTDNKMRLWDSTSGRLRLNYGVIGINQGGGGRACRKSSLAVTDCGLRSVVFCPSDANIQVLDLYTGSYVTEDGEVLAGHFQCVNFVALHPWYHELYSGGNDRNLLVWTCGRTSREQLYEEHLEKKEKGRNETEMSLYADEWSDYSDDEGC